MDWITNIKYGLLLLYLKLILQSAHLRAIQQLQIRGKIATWLNLHLHIVPHFLYLGSFDLDGAEKCQTVLPIIK